MTTQKPTIASLTKALRAAERERDTIKAHLARIVPAAKAVNASLVKQWPADGPAQREKHMDGPRQGRPAPDGLVVLYLLPALLRAKGRSVYRNLAKNVTSLRWPDVLDWERKCGHLAKESANG